MNAPVPLPPPRRGRGGQRPLVAFGWGTIDWAKTSTAAKTGAIDSYFVEQNWDLTRASVAYLKILEV